MNFKKKHVEFNLYLQNQDFRQDVPFFVSVLERLAKYDIYSGSNIEKLSIWIFRNRKA